VDEADRGQGPFADLEQFIDLVGELLAAGGRGCLDHGVGGVVAAQQA